MTTDGEVDTGEIGFLQILDEHGTADETRAPALDAATMLKVYRAMVLTRTFDARAVALQRTGRLGTFASSLGQEAVAVGVGAAMQPHSWRSN